MAPEIVDKICALFKKNKSEEEIEVEQVVKDVSKKEE